MASMKFSTYVTPAAIFAILIVSFLVRVSFDPLTRGDSAFYLRVANNIVEFQCYSTQVDPKTKCQPTYHVKAPGYAFFVALAQALFRKDLTSIVAVQSFLFVMAVALIVFASPVANAGRMLIATGLAFSPLTLFWSRQIMSESLSSTLTLFFTAALLYSIRRNELSLTLVTIPLAAAISVRWEQVWLFLAVVMVALKVYPLKKAAVVLSCIASLMLVPAALWGVRSVADGRSPWPGDPLYGPPGIVEFFKAAELRQELVRDLYWPTVNRQYSKIANFPFYAIPNRLNDPSLQNLIRELSQVPDGTEVPPHIDQEFFAEAERFRKENPYYSTVGVPLLRAFLLWGARDSDFNVKWPPRSGWFWGPVAQAYKIMIVVGSLIFFALALTVRNKLLIYFGGAALLATIIRTAFLVTIPSLEMRYLVHGITLLETFFFLALAAFLFPKSSQMA
jgi:hypothetical protein